SSRANAFQSRKRRSSPAAYSLKFSGSMPSPWTLPSERWPARTVRARLMPSTRRSSLRKNSGSKARASSIAARLHFRGANRLDDALDNVRGVDSVGERGVVEHDPMGQRGNRHMLDIFTRDIGAPVEQRPHLGAQDQRLRAAQARPEHHVAIDL